MPTFANPLGLLALLGIPAVIAIHFLQRKAKELPVSTLFLLDHTRREAASGRRFERLIPSIPLWMQLLAVILLAWFLADPRYQKSGSVQRIAVVMDSSASMRVFKDDALTQLEKLIPKLQGTASEIQLTVLESTPNRPRLHAGTSIAGLKPALESWQPHDGPVDPTQSLRLARSLVSREGTVLYVTDTPPTAPLPFDSKSLAVGHAIENVGFTGVSFTHEQGALVWRALVKNHSTRPADRTWSLQTSNGSTEPRPLHLAPGALVTLQAAFPTGAENVRIVLSADHFPLDDILPIVAPKPKPLTLFGTSALAEKLLHALDAAESTADASTADISINPWKPLANSHSSVNSITYVESSFLDGPWLKGSIVAEPHPLIDGLNWQSLLARTTLSVDTQPTDKILLWQDKRPLILLRHTAGIQQLLINFDPALSNAEKLPAFIVLLHRFAESVRTTKIAPVSENLETSQPIDVAAAPGIPLSITATDTTGKPLTTADSQFAINEPGFLTIRQAENPLLTAAVHFGDPREADFTACASSPIEETTTTASLERHTRPDPLWRVWLLLLLAALLASWKFSASRSNLITDH